DRSESREIKKELEREKIILNNFIELNPYAISLHDAEGHNIRRNKAYIDYFKIIPSDEYSIFDDPIFKKAGYYNEIQKVKTQEFVKIPELWYNLHDISPEYPEVDKCFRLTIFPIIKQKDSHEKYGALIEDVTEQKKAEQKLKESEESFRIILDKAVPAMAIGDLEGNIFMVNDLTSKMTGYSKEELLQMNASDIGLEIIPMNHKKKYWDKLTIGEHIETMGMHRRKDGSVLPVEITIVKLKLKDQPVIAAFVKDISKRRELEQELKGSEEMYRMISENANDIISIISNNSKFIYCNEAFKRILGYTPEELIGTSIFKIIHLEDQKTIFQKFKKLIKTGLIKDITRIRCKDGTYKWLETIGKAVFDENKQLTKLIAVSRDITEQKKMAEKIQESEIKYRTLFEQAADAVILIDPESGEFVEFNTKAHEHLGYTREEFKKLRIPDFEVLQSAEDVKAEFNKILKNGIDVFETKQRTKTGEIRDILVSAKPVEIRGKKYIQTIWKDITEQKKMAEKIRESEIKYRTLFDQAVDTVILIDPESGEFVEFNTQAHEHLGYTREEFKKLRIPDFEVLHSAEEVKASFNKILEDGIAMFETRHKTKTGEFRDILVSAKPVEIRGKKYIQAIWKDISDTKKAEQKLKDSEEKYRELFEKSPISLWKDDFSNIKKYIDNLKAQGVEDLREYLDENLEEFKLIISSIEILDVNKKTLELFKFNTKEDLINRFKDLFPNEAITSYKEGILAFSEGETKFEIELNTLTSVGERLKILSIGEIVSGYENDWSNVLISVTDITDLKKTEQLLKESEEKFRNIAEQSLMGIAIAQDNQIKYINKTYADMWGYNIEEMMNWQIKDVVNVIHPDDRVFILKQLAKKQQGKSDIINQYQYRGIKKSGEIIWVDNYSKTIKFKGKSADFITVINITDKKKAIQNLIDSEEKYRHLFEQSPNTIVLFDLNGTILEFNNKLQNMFGYNRDDFIGKNFSEINVIHPDSLPKAIELFKEIINKGGSATAEFLFYRKDRSLMWGLTHGKLIKLGDKYFIQSIIQDISEHKESEKNLIEYARKLEILNRIILTGNKTDDLLKLLKKGLRSTLELMYFDAGAIYIINESKNNAELICYRGLSLDFLETSKWGLLKDGPYNRVFNQGRPIFRQDYSKIEPNNTDKWNFQTFAIVPLIANKEIIGSLNIISKSNHIFSIQEKDLLLSIGRELGSVISRMKIEESLKEKKRFLSNIFTSIQDGICIIDENHNILQVNPKMEEWYSSMIPLLNKKCYEIFCNSLQPCEDCSCLNSIERKEPLIKIAPKKKRNIDEDGIIETYIFPFQDKQTGEISGIVEYMRDVSEKHEFKNRLRDSEEKSKSILESIKEGYFEVDLQGNITFINNGINNIFGYESDELIGTNFNNFVEENTNKKLRNLFYEIYKTEIPQRSFQFKAKKKNNENLFIETSIYLKFNSKGRKIGFYGLLRDITLNKQAEKLIKEEIRRLKELDKLKNEFVYRASHELKTPLNSISSASNLLLRLHSNKLDKRTQEILEIIKKGGDRLELLINSLLDVSKIEKGALELTLEKINIVDLIKQTVRDLFYLVEEREMNIEIKIDKDLYLIVDKIKIEQVLMNLIVNSIKYTPPRGNISISAKINTNYIDISIKDDGIGFNEEEKKKIFKKFGKIERYGKGSNIITEGSGLG
ncbi:MAG: PAS domain S-box protein, partial [Candidatus Hermodarchaeota archaeon]